MKRNKILRILPALAALLVFPVYGESIRLSHSDCINMAVSSSEDLKKAGNAVRQADLDRQVANTAYLPKIDGSATGTYMLPDMDMMGSKLQVRGAYMAGIQLTQPIYAGGKITAGRRLAKIGREVAGEQLRLCRADVMADADNAYWTYVAVRSKVDLMDQFCNMIDTLFDQTSTAVDAGMATGNDLLRIEAKRSELEYQRQKAANGAELCRLALCDVIGVDADTEILPVDSLPKCEMPASLAADISARPELHLLEMQVRASEQQVKMTLGDFLPTVGLSLGYTYYGNIRMKGMADMGGGNYMPFTQKYQDGIGVGMLAVNIPLFHWGEGAKKVRKAKYAVENARLDLERNRRLLGIEARQAALNVADGERMISAADVALKQATENLRVMQDRYDESMSPLTDLLDAQTQWHQARSNMIEAVTQFQIYLTAWKKANGTLE